MNVQRNNQETPEEHTLLRHSPLKLRHRLLYLQNEMSSLCHRFRFSICHFDGFSKRVRYFLYIVLTMLAIMLFIGGILIGIFTGKYFIITGLVPLSLLVAGLDFVFLYYFECLNKIPKPTANHRLVMSHHTPVTGAAMPSMDKYVERTTDLSKLPTYVEAMKCKEKDVRILPPRYSYFHATEADVEDVIR